MARKPTPGGDRNAWGGIMNEFLDKAHNPDGTLKDSAIADGVATAISNDDTIMEIISDAVSLEPTIAAMQSDIAINNTRVFDVRAFGAVGDGVADDTAAVLACIAACKATGSGTNIRLAEFFVPAGLRVVVSQQLDLRYIWNVNIRGSLRTSYTAGPAVIVGNSSNSSVAISVFIQWLVPVDPGATNVMLRVIGVKNADISVNHTPYMELYADTTTDATNDGSLAYSRFHLGFVQKLNITGVGDMSWINENWIWGARVINMSMTGPYRHNNNKIFGVFEGSTIDIQSGDTNYITGRFEGTNNLTFGSNANFNHVMQTWTAENNRVTPNINVVANNGKFNYVYTASEAYGSYQQILRIDAGMPLTNVSNPFPVGHADRRIRPGFDMLTLPNTFTAYVDTGVFSVSGQYSASGQRYNLRRMLLASDVSNWRLTLYTYNASMTPIQGLAQIGGWVWDGTNQKYDISANVAGAAMPMIQNVQYARLVISGGNPVSPFRYLVLSAHQPPGCMQDAAPIVRDLQRPLAQTSATVPTQSILPKGTMIPTSTGILIVTHSSSTALNVGRASGSSYITVDDLTGIASGDNIAIELDNGQTHFTTVSSVTAGINLGSTTPSYASTGRRVVTQRWLHIT